MSVTIEQQSQRVISVRVSGQLDAREWSAAQQNVARLMGNQTRVSLLVIAENFSGWRGSDWNDMSFQLRHDQQIARLAIVAESKWKDEVLMFAGHGLRDFEIRYFAPADEALARAWVTAPADDSAA